MPFDPIALEVDRSVSVCAITQRGRLRSGLEHWPPITPIMGGPAREGLPTDRIRSIAELRQMLHSTISVQGPCSAAIGMSKA